MCSFNQILCVSVEERGVFSFHQILLFGFRERRCVPLIGLLFGFRERKCVPLIGLLFGFRERKCVPLIGICKYL